MSDDPSQSDVPATGESPAAVDSDSQTEASSGTDDEHVTAYTTSARTLNPTVRWLWVGRSLVVALLLGAVTTAAAFGIAPTYLWVGGVVFAIAAALGVVHSLLLFRSWEYHVREDSMYLDRGVLTQVQTVVPYVRVQHIDTSRGPIERVAGLSSLVVYTAGSRGADVTVPGLTPAEATDLQNRLKALAIESEGEDAV